MIESIAKNIENIRELIARSAEKSGRREEDITLVAVSKNQTAERISEAFQAGLRIFGENRVQEFLSKVDLCGPEPRWHMIGHLQSNKARKLLGKVELIQSVDSINLIHKLSALATQQNRKIELLLQVNTSGEISKSGFAPEMIEDACKSIEESDGILLKGLMTIGPMTDNESEVSASFSRLRELSESLRKYESSCIKMSWLSMGMSGDFEIAIREGSNLVRIGTAIFGPRGPM